MREAWGAVPDRRSTQTLMVALPVGDARGLAVLRLDAGTRRRLVRAAREVEAMPSEWRGMIADELALSQLRVPGGEAVTPDLTSAASVEAHREAVLGALKAARIMPPIMPPWLERLPQGVVRCAALPRHPYLDAWAAEEDSNNDAPKK
jgi:hypothetical protein